MSTPGLIIAAPASGQGKTTVALALMRALTKRGMTIAPAKAGPDYIDPGYHAAAARCPSVNLDPWGMRPETRAALLTRRDANLVVVEGAMGLFDGAADGTGATADLAAETGYPIILIIDAKGQGASAAAVLRGFATHRRDIRLGGVLFNRVGSPRHADILAEAVARSGLDIPVLGCLARDESLAMDSRHLGLVQARERADLDALLDRAADWIEAGADLDAVIALATPGRPEAADSAPPIPPLGQRIAVAQDDAFAFAYPHVLDGWRAAGAEIAFFSPLAGEAPESGADAVYLPGGYPELQAGRLAAASRFLDGLRAAAQTATVYGECGGYMVLGEGLTDSEGARHAMAGLLPLETSFAERRLHLGYRHARQAGAGPWSEKGPKYGQGGTRFLAHEFHYATTLRAEGASLFEVTDSTGADLGAQGLCQGRVSGSFIHLIDRAPATAKKREAPDDLLARVGLGEALEGAERAVDRWLDDATDFLSGRNTR